MKTKTKFDFSNWRVAAHPSPACLTALRLIAWGEIHRYIFWGYQRKEGWIYEDFRISEDTPKIIVHLVEQIEIDFPGTKFIIGHPKPKPPVVIPWKAIGAGVVSVTTVIAYIAAAVVAAYIIATLGTVLLALLAIGAIAAADPVILVYFPETKEEVCVAVWYD